MSKRLAFLEKLTGDGSKDPFAWYGLANEYSNLGRVDEALATFEKLRALDAAYVPQYLMCGQMLVNAKRPAEAKVWLEQGVTACNKSGNTHALSEIQNVLATLED